MTTRPLAVVLALALTLIAPARVSGQPAGFDLQSHAGGRGLTTGESLRAFAKSLEIGVDTLELDIVITKDDQPLVWHDLSIAGTACSDTGPVFADDPAYPYVGKLVRDLTLAQIHTLDCGRPSAEFPRAEVVRGNKIAILPEVFALTDSYRADVRYNIETKVPADHPETSATAEEFVDAIVGAVRAAGKVDRVEIQSFDWRTLPMVHRAEPSIPLVALWNEQTWVPGSPWLAGVDPAVVDDPIVGATMVEASVLSPNYQLVTGKSFTARAHGLGLRVTPWTINDAQTMRTQIGYDVDGIITDYPTTLRGVLAALGMSLPRAYPRP
ncbi:glycerophosphodiester phosphodiesterase family protein [Mycobacterium sp. 1423905.2]|uniref:glycerophosphodiester phosphodiesterase family protein n=1 Tax=Mycobacterium sp. 1423905.2 TaxID=1856859 RepID=UPI0007FF9829|nr:glycerophosphodiester phosphodiesterase family protein [Mycobacterium sp. 1423905.2]OBJ47250.1 glycerophosphodiester phosphodiesterase [Mycobacterium sp. 1423905.2]